MFFYYDMARIWYYITYLWVILVWVMLAYVSLKRSPQVIEASTNLDSDNDGIIDAVERLYAQDVDGDGIRNEEDIDSNGNGILDTIEAFDYDGDWYSDYFFIGKDNNNNWLDDWFESEDGEILDPIDEDDNWLPNYLEIDVKEQINEKGWKLSKIIEDERVKKIGDDWIKSRTEDWAAINNTWEGEWESVWIQVQGDGAKKVRVKFNSLWFLRIRESANLYSNEVGQLLVGETIQVVQEEGERILIEKDDVSGWVSKKYTEEVE